MWIPLRAMIQSGMETDIPLRHISMTTYPGSNPVELELLPPLLVSLRVGDLVLARVDRVCLTPRLDCHMLGKAGPSTTTGTCSRHSVAVAGLHSLLRDQKVGSDPVKRTRHDKTTQGHSGSKEKEEGSQLLSMTTTPQRLEDFPRKKHAVPSSSENSTTGDQPLCHQALEYHLTNLPMVRTMKPLKAEVNKASECYERAVSCFLSQVETQRPLFARPSTRRAPKLHWLYWDSKREERQTRKTKESYCQTKGRVQSDEELTGESTVSHEVGRTSCGLGL